MADETSRSTPAPYKGAKGRLQAMGQQVASASMASGGDDSESTLKPLIAGYEKGVDAETIRATKASELTQLNREQATDRMDLQKDVRRAELELRTTPTTMDYINTAMTGIMLTEAAANRISELASKTETKTGGQKVGERELRTPMGTVNIPIIEPIKYETTTQHGIGVGARKVRDVLGKLLPSLGRMRQGQEEGDAARSAASLNMSKMENIQMFQADEMIRHNLAMETAKRDQTQTVMDAYGSDMEALQKAVRAIEEGNKQDPIEFEKKFREFTSQVDELYFDIDNYVLPTGATQFKKYMGIPEYHQFSPQGIAGEVEDQMREIRKLETLIGEHESYGGSPDAANQYTKGGKIYGSTPSFKSAEGLSLSEMSIGEVRRRMAIRDKDDPDKLLAAGMHQWTNNDPSNPAVMTGTFDRAVAAAGLNDEDLFSSESQHKMFTEYVMSNDKIRAFLANPTPENKKAAHNWLAGTWRSLEDSEGKGPGDSVNRARQDSVKVSNVLDEMLRVGAPSQPKR